MTRATILESNINDDLWPEMVLTMTYIKNNCPTKALNNLSPHKAYFYKQSSLTYLWILSFTMYVLLHKEKLSIKSEKWAPQVLKRTLIGYDRYTIYKVHIKKQNKVIWVKNLCIFEDYKTKKFTKLPDYSNNPLIFQGFHYDADDNQKQERQISCKSQKVSARKAEPKTKIQEG